MSALDSIKSIIPGTGDGSDVSTQTFECDDCGETFETAKDLDRAECPECLSRSVTKQ